VDINHVLQLLINGLVDGTKIALLAASFGLIVAITQRFHVAYISTYVLTVYTAIYLHNEFYVVVPVAALIGLVVGTLLGVGMELVVYRPIARRAERTGNNSLIPIFIASLGITVVVQNLLSWKFNTQPLPFSVMDPTGIFLGDLNFTTLDVATVALGIVVIGGLQYFLTKTRRGRWIEGVRVNYSMAASVGINTGRMFVLVFAVGSLISGLLGLIEATNTAASPAMGFDRVFYGFVVSALAGAAASPLRLAVYGLIIGEVASLSALVLAPAWSVLVVFTILLAYVAFRALQVAAPSLRRRFSPARPKEVAA
jgi:branched-subunit amino acid ABC-type transport system permease component